MKKLFAVIAAALTLASVALAPIAHAVPSQPPSFQDNSNQNFDVPPQFAQNLEFVGAKMVSIGMTSTAQQLVSGPGLVYEVCTSASGSGVASGDPSASAIIYSLLFDLSSIPSGLDTNSRVGVITPAIYAARVSTSLTVGSLNCWVPRIPIQFNNGLVGVQSANTFNTFVYYRPVNPSGSTNQ